MQQSHQQQQPPEEKVIKLRDTASIRRALNQVNMDSIRSGSGGEANTDYQDPVPTSTIQPDAARTRMAVQPRDEGGDGASDTTAPASATSVDATSRDNSESGSESDEDASESGTDATGVTATTGAFGDERMFGDLKEAGAELVEALKGYAKSTDGRTIADCLASISDSLATLATAYQSTGTTNIAAKPARDRAFASNGHGHDTSRAIRRRSSYRRSAPRASGRRDRQDVEVNDAASSESEDDADDADVVDP
jgi:hypothetical protein